MRRLRLPWTRSTRSIPTVTWYTRWRHALVSAIFCLECLALLILLGVSVTGLWYLIGSLVTVLSLML